MNTNTPLQLLAAAALLAFAAGAQAQDKLTL